jgi:hypothetical protein
MADSVAFKLDALVKDAKEKPLRFELDRDLYDRFVAEQMEGDTKESPAVTDSYAGIPVVFSVSVPHGKIVTVAPIEPPKEPTIPPGALKIEVKKAKDA